MKIWAVRHPKPLVANGVCYGQLDLEIDRSQLDVLAQAISSQLPKGLPIYCSSLIRSLDLAKAIHRFRPEATIHSDSRLNEFNFGIWEGLFWSDIPKTEIDIWVQEFPNYFFGGKESVCGFIDRVKSILYELRDADQLILITHAGVIKALHFLSQSNSGVLSDMDDWPKQVIGFGEFELINYLNLNQGV
ncbi:histidine phosphatase family protein [Polynucleobacter sp. 15G-AUS-farblos]|uniref:histidine phosphatase family protein n=1 Tax=Polynucleobacter sp. 15G-AUS-farblos TaxID=2689094 RepID=UPI001C0D7446|nr:histidine phosphatase family protein [Polynucleobacter sp. 15G-AUS-farblos]MBU3583308.1 histidine phosphatase family protein [Polynucleobacter sp. 15G-AUS-farblos]